MAKVETKLKAPFPYFGGKSKIAPEVWARLGDVRNYIEPFIGSAAMLLGRPHAGGVETINDADCYVANFWRATAEDPEAVAVYADSPVCEADLHARHRFLVLSPTAGEFRRRMREDPEFYDAKFAGWWAWGMCCWIGGGWCTAHGETADGGRKQTLPALNPAGGKGAVGGKRPQLCNGNTTHGPGVHGQVPEGRPVITDAFSRGRGVNSNDHASTCAARRAWLTEWMLALADRLRPVRRCCGDWVRVCDSDSTLTRIGGAFKAGKQSGTGVFLDSPYAKSIDRMHAIVAELRGETPAGGGLFGGGSAKGKANRNGSLYGNDHMQDVDRMVARVHVWCAERGADERIRIALCGYAGEHEALEDLGWTCWAWQTQGGYGNRKKAKGGMNTNKARERVWFSPACLGGDAG